MKWQMQHVIWVMRLMENTFQLSYKGWPCSISSETLQFQRWIHSPQEKRNLFSPPGLREMNGFFFPFSSRPWLGSSCSLFATPCLSSNFSFLAQCQTTFVWLVRNLKCLRWMRKSSFTGNIALDRFESQLAEAARKSLHHILDTLEFCTEVPSPGHS